MPNLIKYRKYSDRHLRLFLSVGNLRLSREEPLFKPFSNVFIRIKVLASQTKTRLYVTSPLTILCMNYLVFCHAAPIYRSFVPFPLFPISLPPMWCSATFLGTIFVQVNIAMDVQIGWSIFVWRYLNTKFRNARGRKTCNKNILFYYPQNH